MIDVATLPLIPRDTSVAQGQEFTITGNGFKDWPNEIVLAPYASYALQNDLPIWHLLTLKSKTNTQLVFELTTAHYFVEDTKYSVFATPLDKPRRLLSYTDSEA